MTTKDSQAGDIAARLTKAQAAAVLSEDAPTTMEMARSLVALGVWERCGLTEDEGPAFMRTARGRRVASILQEKVK